MRYTHSPRSLNIGLRLSGYRELAELLGQVKPPTATRDDIAKSGLQIIKASEVTRYEQEGRVASNCVERVGRSRLTRLLVC